jgi:hypothetical protein
LLAKSPNPAVSTLAQGDDRIRLLFTPEDSLCRSSQNVTVAEKIHGGKPTLARVQSKSVLRRMLYRFAELTYRRDSPLTYRAA